MSTLREQLDWATEALDEAGARTESGGFTLGVAGRIRMLRFQLITEANRLRGQLIEAQELIEDARETLASRHIENGTLERINEYQTRMERESGR